VRGGKRGDATPGLVVAAPAACRLEGRLAGDDRPGGHHLVEDLAVDARQTTGDLVGVGTSPARISRPASRRVDHSDGAGREGFRGREESSDVLCRERLSLLPFLFRELRTSRHVLRHQVPVHCLGKGFGQGLRQGQRRSPTQT
jgi:hypothetical protein